jgi:hypothetical protein
VRVSIETKISLDLWYPRVSHQCVYVGRGGLRQEDLKFEVSLGDIGRPYHK